jgi:hypothetical protein
VGTCGQRVTLLELQALLLVPKSRNTSTGHNVDARRVSGE